METTDLKTLFDECPDRRDTNSYKWDSVRCEVPMWVADMDFRTAPCIIDALRRRVDHGVFGYTCVQSPFYDALCGWFSSRHGYDIDRDMVILTPGIVPAISAIIKALVLPGEGVIVQTPVYNCFYSCVRNNGCNLLENTLVKVPASDPGTFTYSMDFDDLENMCARPDAKLLLLCNPGNPSGRLWTRDELSRVADICHRHGVRIVSDEIHCELTMPGTEYVPFATVDPSAVVCVSPTKAFNIAGLQISAIVCPDAVTRAAVDRAVNINEVCDVNPFGVEALKAAYTPEGAEWLDALREYLAENYRITRSMLLESLPDVEISRLEATYLPWVDVSPLGLTGTDAESLILDKTGVRVNAGAMYGDDRFIRLNIACPRELLVRGLEGIIAALSSI